MIFRVDAGEEIGNGHFMRCLALAISHRSRGGSATFVTTTENPALLRILAAADIDVVPVAERFPAVGDFQATQAAISRLARQPAEDEWIVLDGYFFTPEYQGQLRSTGSRLLVIDDTAHLGRYNVDALLNQNLDSGKLSYSMPEHAIRMLGPRYALLRDEFRRQRSMPGRPARAGILVTMGGADPDDITAAVVTALVRGGIDAPITVVIGPSYRHSVTLQAKIADRSDLVSIVRSPGDMAELMDSAEIAISASGTTTWELCCLGVPAVYLSIAENQKGIGEAVAAAGAGVYLGNSAGIDWDRFAAVIGQSLRDKTELVRMSQNAGGLVDGAGAERVLDALNFSA